MRKKINLFLLFSFSLITLKTVHACQFVKNELRELYDKRRQSFKENDLEQEKQLDEKINQLNYQKQMCDKIDIAYQKLLEEQEQKTYPYSSYHEQELRLSSYREFERFVYAHLNNYPENKKILKKRLKIYELGMRQKTCGQLDDSRSANIIYETRELLNKTIGLDDDSIKSDENEETPKDMYIGVRDLCDNNKHLSDWSHKTYILGTLFSGLVRRCIFEQVHCGGSISPCKTMADELNGLFKNKGL